MTRGFVIAATGSGSGKTTVSLAILAWLSKKGYRVAPFKVGPDFIDTGHHTRIAGRQSVNLDSWMLSEAYNRQLFHDNARGTDVAVIEGVMGLFDGFDAQSETGSTAQMAKWLDLPVILVVDAKGMARSAGAMVKGFESFDPDLNLCGVIFTRVGSQRHYEYLKTAVELSCRTPCLGYMPKNEKIALKERHLGLFTAEEFVLDDQYTNELVSMVADHIDMQGLIQSLEPVRFADTREPSHKPGVNAPGQTQQMNTAGACGLKPVIAVARDKAFCFYYPDNLSFLERFGAKIAVFSPLTDDRLPEGTCGIYLGGGYPELYAQILSKNRSLLEQIREKSKENMPIYAECGGFMFLCDTIADMGHQNHYPMAGCFPFRVKMDNRLRALGYREITLKADSVLGPGGMVLRGHEFHYSSLDKPGDMAVNDPADTVREMFRVTTRSGQDISLEGYQVHQTLGSYFHVHFGSNPASARHFVSLCRAWQAEKTAGHEQSPGKEPVS